MVREILTVVRKGEEFGKILVGSTRVARVWQFCARIPQLVKEWVHHGVNG